MRPLKILTWHIHGSYLHYLTQVPHTFYVPVKPGWPEGYGGRRDATWWGKNVIEVPAEAVREADDPSWFQSIALRVDVTGTTQSQAEQLVERFKRR